MDGSIKSTYPLVKLKDILQPMKRLIKKDEYDGSIPVVQKIGFKYGNLELRETNETGMDLYLSYKNEIIVSKINFHQGAVAINEYDELVCSTHYQPYTIKSEKIETEYLILVLRSNAFLNALLAIKSNGIKNEFTSEQIGEIKIPLPTLEEQTEIINSFKDSQSEVEILNYDIQQIEEGIHEYIDNALGITEIRRKANKGLQFVRFKNIAKWGFDFVLNLTEIKREKYEIKKLGDICKVGSGGTPSRKQPEYYEGDTLWVKTTEVRNEIITDTEEKITKEAVVNSSAKMYPAGSLLMAMYGQGLTRGRTAKLGVPATTNQACAVMYDIDNSQVETDYLWLYLQNEYHRLRDLASGNNQPNLNADMVYNYEVVIPPLSIQAEIMEKVNAMREEIKRKKQEAEAYKSQSITKFEQSIFDI